jgi:MinD-like ATPase involved in chromosome partitioning or flagellar assembly
LAINVAFVLAEAGHSVILSDFSVVAEATSETLGLELSRGLGAYLQKSKRTIASSSLAPFLVNLRAGLRVLPPPTELDPGELFRSPERLVRLGQALAQMSEVLILDLGCALSLPTFSLIERLDRVVLVSEVTRIGFRLLTEGWNRLTSTGPTPDRCEAVLVRRNSGRTAPGEERAHGTLLSDRQPVFIPAIAENDLQPAEPYRPPALAQPDSFFAIQVQELAKNLMAPAK